ncbi:MAG: xylulose kinase, partial [Pisciglobus halotolerans]|nr:xylulose kinase [Pisciglobus halotolerans]
MDKFYIGIDIGTTSIKLTVVDKGLNVLDDLQYDYSYLTSEKGFREIDPNIWIEIVLKGLKNIFQTFSASSIAGIGITG